MNSQGWDLLVLCWGPLLNWSCTPFHDWNYFWDEKSLLHIRKVYFGGTGVDSNTAFPDKYYCMATCIYMKICATWCFVTISREMISINEETEMSLCGYSEVTQAGVFSSAKWEYLGIPDKRNLKASLKKIHFDKPPMKTVHKVIYELSLHKIKTKLVKSWESAFYPHTLCGYYQNWDLKTTLTPLIKFFRKKKKKGF